jgi:predicted lipoprotein with Yx(FWY)xxD motif
MRPVKPLLAAALATAAGGAAGATALAHNTAAPGAQAWSTGTTPTIKLTKTSLGKILTVRGFTLYRFTRDRRNHDKCVKIKGCKSVWPPLLSAHKPKAGRGVNAALLGRIKLPNGKHQVTYNGHPLYRYKFDSKGSTFYVGAFQFGGHWYAVNKRGKAVK